MNDKPIKVLSNSGTYVSEEIIRQCFEKGTIHHVNKEMCGNGFSTGFLSLTTEQKGKTDILICPNKSVVKDKFSFFMFCTTIRSKPDSKMGMIPLFNFSIFIGSISTQVTLLPTSAKHEPETSPTYPEPIIVIFIFYFLFLLFNCFNLFS